MVTGPRHLGQLSVMKPMKRFVLFLLFAVCVPLLAQRDVETARVDPITGIIEAFRSHSIVALDEGNHGNEPGYRFRLALIRDPRFAATVDDIVVESGNSLYQELMDRFVRGEDVPDGEIRKAWLNTTQRQRLWDKPIYEQFFRAVRAVNASLPANRRLRVLLGDSPIDRSKADEVVDQLRAYGANARDWYPADLIKREVLAKNRRALVIYGGMHYLRRNLYFALKDPEEAQKLHDEGRTLVGLLENESANKVFSIWTHSYGDLAALQSDIASWRTPSLVLIHDTSWGLASFFSFYPVDGLMIIRRNAAGQTEQVMLHPKRAPARQEEFDAVLYLGPPSDFTYSKN
jgi:hypothetical protein